MFNPNNIKTPEEIAEEQFLKSFIASRTNLIESAVVTVGSGKKFDANEKAQERMARAIKCCELVNKQDSDTLLWSLADTGSGVPTTITFAELKEAFILSVENMSAVWLR